MHNAAEKKKASSAKQPAARSGKTAKKASPTRRGQPSGAIDQLKVTLCDFRPPIWRRLLVPGDFTLGDLHWVLQIAFGWTNSHMHQFVTKDRTYYSDPTFQLGDGPFGMSVHDETRTRLDGVLKQPKDKLTYDYDFGDSWEHELVVEKLLDRDPAATYPRCVAGKQAGPPEDVGGVWGYAELLDILADETHPEREERLEWVGEDFDPAAFDQDAVNRELARLR
ncbi:MAG: plasmid pRiA4b ORF-3 family protein [Planctomycetaceae bacterium]